MAARGDAARLADLDHDPIAAVARGSGVRDARQGPAAAGRMLQAQDGFHVAKPRVTPLRRVSSEE
jgi:hypothetical protein